MKKITVILMCAMALCMVGCKSLDLGKLGDVKPSVNVNDPYKLGKAAGYGGYLGYGVCKGNQKYEKEVAMCEEIWARLQADDDTLTVADLNNLALQMAAAAVSEKEGYVYGAAILLAGQAAGSFADQVIAEKVDTEAVNQFLAGVKDGVKQAQAVIPPDAFKPVEKPIVKAFDCPDGNCEVVVGSRDIKHQTRVANQLIDEGYVSKDEQRKDEYTPTNYENLDQLVKRCAILKKYGVSETWCYIKKFKCEGGKLMSIEFRMIQYDGSEIIVDCVGCCTMPELDDVILNSDIEF